MIITYIVIQKGVPYSNLIYDFIDKVEKRIPEGQRILFDIGQNGENGNKLYIELRDKYIFKTDYLINSIDKKGNSTWKLSKQPLILQFESRVGGTYVGVASPITPELIQSNTLDATFLDKYYPVKPTETPTQNPTSTPNNQGSSTTSTTNWSTLALIGGAAIFLFALLKKKSRR